MKHIINGAGMFCRTKASAVPAGEWVQCHHSEINPLFEYAIEIDDHLPEPRWFYNNITRTLMTWDEIVSANFASSDCVEVPPEDLQYVKDSLERDDIGDLEYRAVKRGDKYLSTCGLFFEASSYWCGGDRPSFVRKSKPAPKFVEYPICVRAGKYYEASLPHIPDIISLHEAPSIVGFAGIKFQRQDGSLTDWLFETGHYELKNESTPATPVKMRVFVTGDVK